MATVQSPYQRGDLFGFRYLFEKAGDGLRRHEHTAESAHNVIVLHGSVSVNVEGHSSRIVTQGNVLDFDWTRPHDIIALEPNTLVLNLMLFGMPDTYVNMPPSEFNSVFDING